LLRLNSYASDFVSQLPEQDIRLDLLESAEITTRCPYKGKSSYRSARVGERVFKDIV